MWQATCRRRMPCTCRKARPHTQQRRLRDSCKSIVKLQTSLKKSHLSFLSTYITIRSDRFIWCNFFNFWHTTFWMQPSKSCVRLKLKMHSTRTAIATSWITNYVRNPVDLSPTVDEPLIVCALYTLFDTVHFEDTFTTESNDNHNLHFKYPYSAAVFWSVIQLECIYILDRVHGVRKQTGMT